MLKVTLKAKIFIQDALDKEDKRFCLLSVISGGCSGLRYNIVFINELPEYEVIYVDDNIIIDTLSAEILQTCKIDLHDELGYRKIAILNTQAVSSCSCGDSFSI